MEFVIQLQTLGRDFGAAMLQRYRFFGAGDFIIGIGGEAGGGKAHFGIARMGIAPRLYLPSEHHFFAVFADAGLLCLNKNRAGAAGVV